MAAATQMMTDAGDGGATATQRLATAMLARVPTAYSFSFTPFLQSTYHHGLPADRPVCRAYSAGHCPLGARCPERHVSSATTSGGGRECGFGFNSLVCKHWLRGLCKKGEGCEFLHEYNLRKMPECNFFLRNGYCSNGDECLYLHIDPRSKLPPCPDYDGRGFCALGPRCTKKHVRRTICPCYLAGFCPDGRACKAGAHPHWSTVAVVPVAEAAAVLAQMDAAAAEAALHAATLGPDDDDAMNGLDDDYFGGGDGDDRPDRFHGREPRGGGGGFRDKFGGPGRGGGGRWRGRGGGSGRGFRGRGH